MRVRTVVLVCLFLTALLAAGQGTPLKQLAITIDDFPKAVVGVGTEEPGDLNDVRATLWQLTSELRGTPAIGFVNESKLYVPGEIDQRLAALQMWLDDDGHELGNHTLSHLDFQTTPVAQFEADVLHGDVLTAWLLHRAGLKPRYFRFPYNHTGPTMQDKQGLEQFLHAHGYTLTPFTVAPDDYIFNDVYTRARRRWDSELQEKVRAAYLAQLDLAMDYSERVAHQLFGRDIAHVLLIHANDLNADAIKDVLSRLRKRGYTFVSLEEAMRDPAYQTRDDYVGPHGISWLSRWAVTKHVSIDTKSPDPPPWVMELYNQAQKK